MAYPKAGSDNVPARPHFPDVELDVLDYWERHGIFHETVEARKSDEEFVFYDGPPFANGLPHYGHLLAGYAKDVVPRYQTMRGRRVERRFGWTSHGLPAELDAEKQLGITAKFDIERMGVARFNEVCRTTVMRYTHEWRDYVTRQARWVDFDQSVKTHDLDYMESVMWAFKTMWDKGLIYQGHSVSWYCPHCETPLANAESSGRIDGSDTHREVPGTTVIVGVRLDGGELLLVESDAPWALPATTAVAVHPDAEYAVVEKAGSATWWRPTGSTPTPAWWAGRCGNGAAAPSWRDAGTSRCSTSSPPRRTRTAWWRNGMWTSARAPVPSP